MNKLQWRATGDHWEARMREQWILIPASTYHQHLQQFLAQQGIDLKTWTHYLQPALQAWNSNVRQKQCFNQTLTIGLPVVTLM